MDRTPRGRWKGMDVHMKKNRGTFRALALALLCTLTLVTVSRAVSPGTDKDPLVTLSYLNETFLGEVMKKVDAKIAERDQKLAAQGVGSAAANFAVVDLSKGQTLTGTVGTEVMLRVGSAQCVSHSAPGLIDETDGQTLNGGGALVKNHLYMMTIEGRGVKAASDSVKVLVRGAYTIA